MKKLMKYLSAYRKECILGPLFKMLEATFELFVPLVVAAIIDVGIAQKDSGYIVRMCLLMAALGAIGLANTLVAQYFAAKAAVGFSAKIRHILMQHIQQLSYTSLDKIGSSTMITRMTSDVNQVQTGVNLAIRLLLRSPFIVFGAMIMAFTVDVKGALVFAVIIPLLSIVVFGIMLVSIPLFQKVQQRLDHVTGAAQENLSGVRVIRAFRMEAAENENFAAQNLALTRMQKMVGKISALMNPLTYILINGAVIALIWVGAVRVDAGLLTQGAVVALYNYMSQILVELIKLANLIITLTKTAACGNRIQNILEMPVEEDTAPETTDFSAKEIVFDHVSLTYADAAEPALSDISFTAHAGETIGIIGGTGSGKTSLVNLIPRFYEPTEGHIYIHDTDSKDCSKKQLRSHIGIVPQKALLFKGSIRKNMLWGNENASEANIQAALDAAQAADVVASKPNGLDEMITEGGRNLSGGQRQRLTIARALVRQPDCLILDDSASALDYATDAALRQALRSLPNHMTVFIVSQRTASIRFADRILVLDDGRLVGTGTHEQLLQSCDVYQEIYYSQFPKKEDAAHEA